MDGGGRRKSLATENVAAVKECLVTMIACCHEALKNRMVSTGRYGVSQTTSHDGPHVVGTDTLGYRSGKGLWRKVEVVFISAYP